MTDSLIAIEHRAGPPHVEGQLCAPNITLDRPSVHSPPQSIEFQKFCLSLSDTIPHEDAIPFELYQGREYFLTREQVMLIHRLAAAALGLPALEIQDPLGLTE